VSSETIGWWTSAAATAYATFQEFLPPTVKAVVGTVLAAATATGSFKAWRAKLSERRAARENR
jgi:hypothetical protein